MNIELDRPCVPPEERSTVFAEFDIDPGEKREPATRQVLICIDGSAPMGSVTGTGDSRIERIREGAKKALDFLNDDDRLGIVSFDSRPSTVQDVERVGDLDADEVRRQIDDIDASGGTDIYGALERSHDMLSGLPDGENTTTRILLLSDGRDGQKDAPEFEPLATEIGDDGIEIVSAGVGAAYDRATIRTISEASGGWWNHLADPQELLQFFEYAIEDAGKTVRGDPEIRIDAASGFEVMEAFRRQPQVQSVRLLEADGTYVVRLPDLPKRQRQQVLFELEVPERPEGEVRLGDIRLDAGRPLLSESLHIEYTGDLDRLQQRSTDLLAKWRDRNARTTPPTADAPTGGDEVEQTSTIVPDEGQFN
jgi:Ca-activated chloride channel family protein